MPVIMDKTVPYGIYSHTSKHIFTNCDKYKKEKKAGYYEIK